MVNFLPLDITKEESVNSILLQIDNAIQYGEDLEPKEMPVSLQRFTAQKILANKLCYLLIRFQIIGVENDLFSSCLCIFFWFLT